MKCHACQAEFEDHSVYCPNCGARAEPSANEAEIPPQVPAGEEPPPETVPEADAASLGAPSDAPLPDAEEDIRSSGTMSDRLKDIASSHRQIPDDPATRVENPWTEGGYAGKAMRAAFLFTALITALFVVLGIWLTMQGWAKGWWTGIAWGILMLVPALLWLRAICAYIYRVWTIKYRLTEHRFYHEEGIFRRVRDVIEVFDIDDMKLERTLWDRLINGGVGTVVIRSTDTSHPMLKLRGLAEPERVFESLDEARRKQRAKLGLKAI